MPVYVAHCHVTGCGAKCLRPSIAAILVVLVASGILAKPVLNSLGVQLSSVVAAPLTLTYGFLLYVGVWMLAVFLGVTRKHENALWCAVDSAGIPAVAALAVGMALSH